MTSVTRTVEVTQEDIDKGCALNGQRCPVARAFTRTFPEFTGIDVMESEVVVAYNGWTKKLLFSEDVEERIRSYDKGNGMEPFSFDMAVDI